MEKEMPSQIYLKTSSILGICTQLGQFLLPERVHFSVAFTSFDCANHQLRLIGKGFVLFL